jgi:hypothetical protein
VRKPKDGTTIRDMGWEDDTQHSSQSDDRGQGEQPKGARLECIECGARSSPVAFAWRGCRIDVPGAPPALAFYCPTCFHREFRP